MAFFSGHTLRLLIAGIAGTSFDKPLIGLAQSKEDFVQHKARNRAPRRGIEPGAAIA
jgi:hypothetical protein